jgi:hypothetical protein
MNNIDRRRLFKLAAAGSVAAAGAAVPVVGRLTSNVDDHPTISIRATHGLPEPPLPSYATYVVEGTLNLATGAGLITTRVLAGHPGDPSEIGLPGLTRVININQIDSNASQLRVRGVIEDRSQLQPGESSRVELLVDRTQRTVTAPFVGRTVTLAMV